MPFKSQAQRSWMYAVHPEMAEEWEAHTPKGKKLPKKVKKKPVNKNAKTIEKKSHSSSSKGHKRISKTKKTSRS